MTRSQVNPKLLTWARKRAGLECQVLSAKSQFKKLLEWESGEAMPTLDQLNKFARTVNVPLGYLFLKRPPEEQLPITDFRTIGNVQKKQSSPDLIDTIYAMQRRQSWLSEYLVENEAEKLPIVGSVTLQDNPNSVGKQMRKTLELTKEWRAQMKTWEQAVTDLRGKIEDLGVITVTNGIVGNNTQRKLKVKEFRGFALCDRYAPLIFVNGADSKSAQMFTLAHELAHIWLDEEGLTAFEFLNPGGPDVEKWCNQAAAELLVPALELEQLWDSSKHGDRVFKELSREFKVSPIVIARRCMDLKYISRETFVQFYYKSKAHEEEQVSRRKGGGDFYLLQDLRVGKRFATYVVRAAMEGQIGFKEAHELTDLYGTTFQKYTRTIK